MLADPQSVTVSTVAHSMPRTSTSINLGEFSESDGTFKLRVQHQYGSRVRRVIRLDHTKIAADPLISAQNIVYKGGMYVVFDMPITGFTVTEAKADWDGFAALLAASSGAIITKVLGGES
jgi:hypothetical protein